MNFLTNIDALRNFVEVLLPVAVEHDTQEHSRVMDDMHSLMLAAGFTEDQIGRKDGELGAPENPPTLDREAMMSRLAPIFRRLLPLVTVPKPETLYRSAFVMLNCHFDHLIAGLITHYYDTFPDALSGKDTSLTLADLKSCSNIEDARGMIVSKVVRSITGESLDKQMKFFRETAKVNGADSAANWRKLRKSVARRNLIVHSGGVVNRTYLEDVPLTDRPGDSKTASVGTQLRVSPDYFTETLDEFLLAGSALTQCCWRKWHKTELDAADSELIDVLYQALLKERWRLAERIGEFAISCKTSSEENRLVLLFNYCISLKQLGSRDKLGSCIAKLDASALGPKFKAAVAALCDDKEALHKHLRDALATRVIEPSEIREWPLLREARSDPHFYERLGLAQSAPPKPALPSPELPGTAPVVVTNPPSAASRKP